MTEINVVQGTLSIKLKFNPLRHAFCDNRRLGLSGTVESIYKSPHIIVSLRFIIYNHIYL